MKSFTCALSIFMITVTNIRAAHLPSNFMKCDRKSENFSKCLPKAVEDAMKKLNKPVLGLPSLNPLEVSEMTIGGENTGAVGLKQHFKNLKIFGINNLECTRMDVDFEKKTIENQCFYPQIKLEGDYILDGRILLLDIKGKGPGSVTLDKVIIAVSYKLEEYEKKSQKHWRIVDCKVKIIPSKMQIQLESILDGADKQITDNVIQVVNENWKEVFEDVRSGYEKAFGQIVETSFNNLLERVSIPDLFGAE